jgi:3-deoxy-manno-octulosonate cytidylyltransferase (CMP-KDO synthetase)
MAIGIIPARFASSRFPGKSLAQLAGYPLIQHVYCAASHAETLSDVWVATDDERIRDAVTAFGGKALMTRPDHASGTDRLVEALDLLNCGPDEIIVNIQGDEPLIRPDIIDACATALEQATGSDWATLVFPVNDDEARDPNLVKVVLDCNGYALYFSRLPIPYDRDGNTAPVRYGHAGLYAYRARTVREFASLPPGRLERAEMLEQLRALENGMRITCAVIDHVTPGVDTPADLARVEAMLLDNPSQANIPL